MDDSPDVGVNLGQLQDSQVATVLEGVLDFFTGGRQTRDKVARRLHDSVTQVTHDELQEGKFAQCWSQRSNRPRLVRVRVEVQHTDWPAVVFPRRERPFELFSHFIVVELVNVVDRQVERVLNSVSDAQKHELAGNSLKVLLEFRVNVFADKFCAHSAS